MKKASSRKQSSQKPSPASSRKPDAKKASQHVSGVILVVGKPQIQVEGKVPFRTTGSQKLGADVVSPGFQRTDAARLRMSEAATKRFQDPQQRAAISAALTGITRSDATRRKMRKSAKARWARVRELQPV